MRPVYLLIEEVNRELLSRLLIGRRASALGHPVLIGQQWWFAANFAALPPGVVLFKGNNRIQAQYMHQAKRAGHRVASIDEECFVSSSAVEIAAQYDPGVAEHCDLIFVQGAFQRDAVTTRLPSAASRISLTGNPRADLLRDPAFRPTDPDVTRYRAARGPYLLENTNFTTINPKLGDVYTYFQICSRIGVLEDPAVKPLDRFLAWCHWERANLRAMVRLIRSLAARADGRRIVLRPHPSERNAVWRNHYADVPGIDVIGDGDHLAWIDAADLLLRSGCSTGLEAYLLGRPAISVTPGDRWWPTPAISNIVNPVAKDAAAALSIVDTVLGGGAMETSANADLGTYLSDEPGDPAARRISAALSRLSHDVTDRAGGATARPVASPVSQRIIDKAFVPIAVLRRRLAHLEAATGHPEALAVREIAPSVFQLGGDPGVFAAVAG